jgi:hypothetical protein
MGASSLRARCVTTGGDEMRQVVMRGGDETGGDERWL